MTGNPLSPRPLARAWIAVGHRIASSSTAHLFDITMRRSGCGHRATACIHGGDDLEKMNSTPCPSSRSGTRAQLDPRVHHFGPSKTPPDLSFPSALESRLESDGFDGLESGYFKVQIWQLFVAVPAPGEIHTLSRWYRSTPGYSTRFYSSFHAAIPAKVVESVPAQGFQDLCPARCNITAAGTDHRAFPAVLQYTCRWPGFRGDLVTCSWVLCC